MGLMILTGTQNVMPMWLLLVGAIGLTFTEAREQRLDAMRTIWWMLGVAMTHVVGYLAMRGWVAWRKRQT